MCSGIDTRSERAKWAEKRRRKAFLAMIIPTNHPMRKKRLWLSSSSFCRHSKNDERGSICGGKKKSSMNTNIVHNPPHTVRVQSWLALGLAQEKDYAATYVVAPF